MSAVFRSKDRLLFELNTQNSGKIQTTKCTGLTQLYDKPSTHYAHCAKTRQKLSEQKASNRPRYCQLFYEGEAHAKKIGNAATNSGDNVACEIFPIFLKLFARTIFGGF